MKAQEDFESAIPSFRHYDTSVKDSIEDVNLFRGFAEANQTNSYEKWALLQIMNNTEQVLG